MDSTILPPFSVRSLGAHLQIEGDFPESARTGLLHLLHDLVEKEYVNGWITVAQELQRIAREPRVEYNKNSLPDISRARAAAKEIVLELPWQRVYDFCERLHGALAREVTAWDHEFDQSYVTTSLEDVQRYVANELTRLFLEESFAYAFVEGRVEHRGRAHTSTQISRAQLVLGDPRLESARKHFNKALKYFRDVSNPDPENAVKEAVCAVEATARALFPNKHGNTLGEIVKSMTGHDTGQLPKAIAQTFHGLYGFRSGGVGVAHGGTAGGTVTTELAEYVIAVAASQMILLVDLANAQEETVPI